MYEAYFHCPVLSSKVQGVAECLIFSQAGIELLFVTYDAHLFAAVAHCNLRAELTEQLAQKNLKERQKVTR
jgi:hypothetical protein